MPMTQPWNRRLPHQKPKPTSAAIIAAMRAVAPTAEATAAVDALGKRWAARAKPEQPARPGGNRNFARGMEAESKARAALRKGGWFINSSRTGSFGQADILAHRTEAVADIDRPAVETLHIQVKRLATFEPSGLNEAVRDYLRIGPKYAGVKVEARHRMTAANSREAWLYVDGEKWAAVAVLDAEDRITVTGPRHKEVEHSIGAMTERAETPKNTTVHNTSLRTRMGISQ